MPLPGLPPTSCCLVVAMSFAQTAALLASRGEATALAMLVDGIDDPADAGIAADSLVRRVDKDDLVVLIRRVLVDPVRV